MKKRFLISILTMLFFMSMLEAVSAVPIRYNFSGHITSVTALNDALTAVGDQLRGWIEVESDTFSPGGEIYDYYGINDGYIEYEKQNGNHGQSGQPRLFTWGETIDSLPSSFLFLSDDNFHSFEFDSMSYSGVLEATFRDETNFIGTLDSFSSVPEPATILLLGTGIAALAGTRIRRKK